MSKCPHKQLKKQMVGEQCWYVCECGQKFRIEAWDGKVVTLDTGTTPPRDQFIFDKDTGGNSVFTRLEAEIAFNRDKPEHEMATDTSLSHGDLRKIVRAFRRQGDFTDALTANKQRLAPPDPRKDLAALDELVAHWNAEGKRVKEMADNERGNAGRDRLMAQAVRFWECARELEQRLAEMRGAKR